MIVEMRETQDVKDALVQLIDYTGLDSIVMIEVGSYAGASADVFASTGKVKALFCIDPWMSGYDCKDIASKSDFKEVEDAFDRIADKHKGIIVKHRGTLSDFIEAHPDVRPDLIYIDACHTYEAATNDINLALKTCCCPYGQKPKYISGHDYCDGWSGVKKAVDEAFEHPDATFADNSWIVRLDKRTETR